MRVSWCGCFLFVCLFCPHAKKLLVACCEALPCVFNGTGESTRGSFRIQKRGRRPKLRNAGHSYFFCLDDAFVGVSATRRRVWHDVLVLVERVRVAHPPFANVGHSSARLCAYVAVRFTSPTW
ncbi:unnamed protein product [Ectocarpus sp. 4 AP-2014]